MAKEIRETIKSAKLSKRPLLIRGYVDSSGTVKDLVISFANNYRSLAEQSLKLLPKLEKPSHIDSDHWHSAYDELFNSYMNYLSNPPGQGGGFNGGIVINVDGCTYTSDVSAIDTLVVICDVEKISETILHQGEVKVVQSRAKTLAKKWIKEQLPENAYIPRLNLSAGKFKSLEVV
jgi:hypothetical protein